ncbi:Alpha/beta hydrolase fold-1 [Phlebopus sp. FC_14]|nr:Alpha/beta hydrolase fold-1 [Phlebopus sp. FC_14]
MSSSSRSLPSPTPESHVLALSTTLGNDALTLQCSALRYPVSDRGISLVFTHGVAGHKEQWHPVVTRLLEHHDTTKCDIREIWSLDFPNHGETAMLNRTILDERKARGLKEGFVGTCTTTDYAAYLVAFLNSPHLRGRTVVGLGHSGSCTVWVHALTQFPFPHHHHHHHHHLHSLILIEPTLMFPSMSPEDPRSIHGASNVRGALAKRDHWGSRQEARRWLVGNGARGVWAKRDTRVLDLFVEYAFEDVKTANTSYTTTPTLRKDEESPLYACLAHTIQPRQLARVCAMLNEHGKRGVHVVWAEIEEFISKTAKTDILDAAEYRVTTQRTIRGAGHAIPQEKPEALADGLEDVLQFIGRNVRAVL